MHTLAPALSPSRSPSAWKSLGRVLLLSLAIALPAAGMMVTAMFAGDVELTAEASPLGLVIRVWLVNTAVSALMIGVLHGGRHLLRGRTAGRTPALVAIVLLATVIGVITGVAADRHLHGMERSHDTVHPYLWQQALMLCALLMAAAEYLDRTAHTARRMHEGELRGIALDAELSAARLQLLQAQVEPHFLFNSLANLRRLQHTDVPAAREMLAALLRYLEEALPRLREPGTTLGREAELVRAYLALHQVRMGARLAVEIDVPEALRAQPVPSMMLLTLVENAIKHGLQPLVAGGTVRVAAAERDGQLVLTVADTGRGMGNASGGGLGLSNLRARLKALHGSAAQLTLHLNEPSGVVATITMPMAAGA